jgi:hypothetical protein
VVSIFLSQVTFLLLRVGPQNLPRRKASTYPLFSQHPGREALIEPLSRMPREIPWKPGFTLDQLIKQSRGVFLGSEIIGGAPWGWNVPLGNNTHEAELKLSPTDHRDWFIVGRIATFQTDNTPGVLPQRDHPGWDLSSLRDFALYPTPTSVPARMLVRLSWSQLQESPARQPFPPPDR